MTQRLSKVMLEKFPSEQVLASQLINGNASASVRAIVPASHQQSDLTEEGKGEVRSCRIALFLLTIIFPITWLPTQAMEGSPFDPFALRVVASVICLAVLLLSFFSSWVRWRISLFYFGVLLMAASYQFYLAYNNNMSPLYYLATTGAVPGAAFLASALLVDLFLAFHIVVYAWMAWEHPTLFLEPMFFAPNVLVVCSLLAFSSRIRTQVRIREIERRIFSEKKQAQDLILKQQQQLAHSAKMVALGEMAAGIAHEINNPLAILSVKTAMLDKAIEREKLTVDFIRPQVDGLERAVQRISDLVSAMLSLSGKNPTPEILDWVSAESIIQLAVSLCQERFRNRGIAIKRDPIDESVQVKAELSRVSYAVFNLLENAFDSMEPESMGRGEKWIEIECRRSGAAVEISVMNSGPLIPVEIREKIFQPFFTTKPPGRKMGLGLSVTQSVIEEFGGEIFLDPASRFTRFVIRLPGRAEGGRPHDVFSRSN